MRNRGIVWVIGAFVICPCHLPLTLGLLAMLLGGTALGAALHAHPIAAGIVISAVWGAATWRGIHLMQTPPACPRPPMAGPRESGRTSS